jgi:SSS family solute:Na+ symporter
VSVGVLGWFSLFFIAFSVVYYFVGLMAGQAVASEDDYFLAGRSVGFFPLTATLLATQIGGGLILGIASDAYQYGFAGMYYSFGIALGFIILGCGIAGKMRSFNVATMAELFEKFYHSTRLKQWASFLSILSLSGIFLSQVVASRSLLYGLGVESDALFWIFWVSLVAYTMYGGLPAVVATDILQMIVIVLVFVSAFGVLVYKGLITTAVVPAMLTTSDSFVLSHDYWIACLLMPILFSFVEQDLAQRFFSAKSPGIARASSWVAAGGVLIFAAIPAVIGVLARTSQLAIPEGHNPLVVYVGAHLGVVGQALVLCALVAAVASTADSLLCAISSNVVQDFGGMAGRETRLWGARATTVIVGILGVVGSFYCSNILHIVAESYQLLVSSIFVSTIMCFFIQTPSRRAGLWSVVAGGVLYTSLLFCAPGVGSFRAIIALAGSLIAFVVGHMLRDDVGASERKV